MLLWSPFNDYGLIRSSMQDNPVEALVDYSSLANTQFNKETDLSFHMYYVSVTKVTFFIIFFSAATLCCYNK